MTIEDATAPPAPPEDNAAPAAPSAAPADAPDWRAGLPRELRDALGDADPAEAAGTYARGKEYAPAQKAEDIALDLDGGAALHPGTGISTTRRIRFRVNYTLLCTICSMPKTLLLHRVSPLRQ